MQRPAHLLVFDGLADWEPSYALTGLRHWAKMPVRTVGFDTREVTTIAGLRIAPDIALAELEFAREVFAELQAFTDAEIAEWYDMYRSGRMPSVPATASQ